MPIKLKPEAVPSTAKVYPLSQPDRKFINEEFNKLHDQGKLIWTSEPTAFGYPVFVVWRTVEKDGKPVRKGRVVVDIRGLNKITQTDSYPLPLQSDIIRLLKDYSYITVADGSGFFY